MNYKGDQEEAYKFIRQTLFNNNLRPPHTAALKGYAGTGKTTLTAEICSYAANKGYYLFLCAPTHQAKEVMVNNLLDKTSLILGKRVSAGTIHSMLGLALEKDKENGGYYLAARNAGRIPDHYKVLIVLDEGSMVNEQVGKHIWEAVNKHSSRVRWLFIGDPAQLPPPNGKQSTILTAPASFTMKKIIRQGNKNPIIEASRRIRNGASLLSCDNFKNGVGIGSTTSRQDIIENVDKQLNREDYATNPYICRVLAATNKEVQRWNKDIKNYLWPHSEEWEVDFWGIAQSTWFRDNRNSEYPKPVIYSSELFKVLNAKEIIHDVSGFAGEAWQLQIEKQDESKETLITLKEETKKYYEQELQDRLRIAQTEGGKKWTKYYDLKEGFCDVRYNFASTVHKSQGSTFENVYIDFNDIASFPGGRDLTQRLQYVAVTRASKRVGFLK